MLINIHECVLHVNFFCMYVVIIIKILVQVNMIIEFVESWFYCCSKIIVIWRTMYSIISIVKINKSKFVALFYSNLQMKYCYKLLCCWIQCNENLSSLTAVWQKRSPCRIKLFMISPRFSTIPGNKMLYP